MTFNVLRRLLLGFLGLFLALSSVIVLGDSARASAANAGATSPSGGSIAEIDTKDPASTGGGGNDGQTDAALQGTTGIVGQAAITGLTVALNKLGVWTTPQVSAKNGDGTNWFVVHYRMMRVMGLWILMPMVLIAIIHAVFKSSVAMLLKTVFVYLPIAIVGTAAAVDLVQLLLNVTDDFSKLFLNAVQADANAYFTSIAQGFANTGVPIILDLVGAVFLLAVCVALYIIMVVRESSVYIATSFLPIGFALMVWPSTARFFRRMVEFLIGIILSKLVMVAAISLAVASLTATASTHITNGGNTLSVNGDKVAAGISTDNDGSDGANMLAWLANLAAGIATLIVVCYAPHMTVRLVGNLGIGEMGSHAAGAMQRPSVYMQVIFADRLNANMNNALRLTRARSEAHHSREVARRASYAEQRLEAGGVYRNQYGNYQISTEHLDRANITDPVLRAQLMAMTDPNVNARDASQIYRAKVALAMGADFDGFGSYDPSTNLSSSNVLHSKTGRTAIVLDISDRKGKVIHRQDPAMVRRLIRTEADRQIATTGGITGIHVVAPQRSRFDRGTGRVRAQSNAERDDERNISRAVWRVRGEYEQDDGRSVRIGKSFRASSSAWSDNHRDINPRYAAAQRGSHTI